MISPYSFYKTGFYPHRELSTLSYYVHIFLKSYFQSSWGFILKRGFPPMNVEQNTFIDFIGVTLVHGVTEVPSAGFRGACSVCCTVCPPPDRPSSVTTYSAPFHPPLTPQPLCSGNQHAVSVSVSFVPSCEWNHMVLSFSSVTYCT